jgi:hypothetical protein
LYPERRYLLEQHIQNGLITFTKEDIESIKQLAMNRWICFLTIVARNTPEFPSWNLTLPGGCIGLLWRYTQAFGPFQYKWKDVQYFLCTPGKLRKWYQGMRTYPYSEPEVGLTKEELFRFFEDCIRNFPDWGVEFILESDAQIRENQIVCTQVHDTLRNRNTIKLVESEEFFAWRMSKKSDWYKEQKAKCEVFKEELMAVTWHPDRFFSWCLDWKEKEEMNECWRIE